MTSGSVALVGAGPGDPDLLTLRAVKLIAAADVVVHDALVGDGILALVPPGTELIDVGKRPGRGDEPTGESTQNHGPLVSAAQQPKPDRDPASGSTSPRKPSSVAQELISTLLVSLARDGRRVVRLKGGDPFVFGRGGEEAIALGEAGIAVEVVPGISSAVAAPAAAGIPVTHRGVSAAFTVVTGHRRAGEPDVDWRALARVGGTIVVLMGVASRAAIAGELQAGGLAPDTPVAAVRSATTPREVTLRCRLDELAVAPVESPAVIVVGAVAAFDVNSPNLVGATVRGIPARGHAA